MTNADVLEIIPTFQRLDLGVNAVRTHSMFVSLFHAINVYN